MLNKDFLKLVLKNHKAFLPLKDLKQVHVPLYDELAIKHIYPLV